MRSQNLTQELKQLTLFFRIIERGHTDKKMAEQLKETREKIYQLENGRPLQMTESPFDSCRN